MQVSVSDAKAQLTDLVKRAESGDEVVLTRHGRAIVRLVAIARPSLTEHERRARMDAIVRKAQGKATPGPDAARSQDFLYDAAGLPQ